MAGKIRVLDSINRSMQRLGYLKLLCSIVNETETSNLTSLGNRLIDRVSKQVKLSLPLEESLRDYVKNRLTDRIFRDLRKAVLENTNHSNAALEIQDVLLSDADLPSRVGRLVKDDKRHYPYLGTALGFIKKGTYSALTRSLVLLAVTPKEELNAFNERDTLHNPMRITDAQKIIFLYSLIDNDAEVVFPLFQNLMQLPKNIFNERQASEFLPEIYRKIANEHLNRSITVEERDRLAILLKSASSIEKWKGRAYTGGGAQQIAIRVRLEPYCDIGLLNKPDKNHYEYNTTDSLKVLLESWGILKNTDTFLQNHFFQTFALFRGIKSRQANETEAIESLYNAGETLKSSLGYTPIIEVGLVAGTHLLINNGVVLELSTSLELLKKVQKKDPGFVRFTVDRMGAMAHVKFLKSTPDNPS